MCIVQKLLFKRWQLRFIEKYITTLQNEIGTRLSSEEPKKAIHLHNTKIPSQWCIFALDQTGCTTRMRH